MKVKQIQCSEEVQKVVQKHKKETKVPITVFVNEVFIKAGLLNKDGSIKN